MTSASLSIVVVTYNSASAIRRTLEALLGELAEGDEVIVVDNASADGTPAVVAELCPAATVLANPGNTGFAAAANQGAAAATRDVLVLLNPDAAPAPGWGAAIRSPAGGPYAAWMALVSADDGRIVNTSGGVVHLTGIAWAGQAIPVR